MRTFLVLAILVAVATSHDFGDEKDLKPTTSIVPKDSNCGDVMEEVNVCMDTIHDSQDAKAFGAKREEIFKGCVQTQTPQCAAQMSAIEKCQTQARTDPILRKNREEVKVNVTKCYEQFPNTKKTGGNRPQSSQGGFHHGGPHIGGGPPFGVPPGPPPPGFVPDPCAPAPEEILCLKYRMDNDPNITTLGGRLREQERQCFTKPTLFNCRPDNGQLRQCLDQTAQSFMLQVVEKIKKCVRDAGFEMPPLPPPPPPHGFSG